MVWGLRVLRWVWCGGGLVCWICVAELLGVYFYFEFGLQFWFGCLWSAIDGWCLLSECMGCVVMFLIWCGC